MKNVVMFTHNDLDGYSCYAVMNQYLLKCTEKYSFNGNFQSNNDIDEVINKWIDFYTNENEDDVYIFITDIGINHETAERLNKFYKTGAINLTLIDHHKTNSWLNDEYSDWAHVTVFNSKYGIPECGTSLLVQWLYNPIFYHGFGKDLGYPSNYDESVYLRSYADYVRLYDTYTFKEWDRASNNYRIPTMLNRLFRFYDGSFRFFDLLFSEENRTDDDRFYIDNDELVMIDNILHEKDEATILNATKEIWNKVFQFTINNQPKTAAVCFGLDCCNEIADRVLTKHLTIDYVFIFGNDHSVGLRSKAEIEDCSVIAKAFGGGGHLHAAGFPDDQGFDYGRFFNNELQILL